MMHQNKKLKYIHSILEQTHLISLDDDLTLFFFGIVQEETLFDDGNSHLIELQICIYCCYSCLKDDDFEDIFCISENNFEIQQPNTLVIYNDITHKESTKLRLLKVEPFEIK